MFVSLPQWTQTSPASTWRSVPRSTTAFPVLTTNCPSAAISGPAWSMNCPSARGCRPSTMRCWRKGRKETLRFADLEPFVDFKHQGEFLSSSGYRTVTVQSTNLDQAELTVDRVYRNNLFALFQFRELSVSPWPSLSERHHSRSGDLDSVRDIAAGRPPQRVDFYYGST